MDLLKMTCFANLLKTSTLIVLLGLVGCTTKPNQTVIAKSQFSSGSESTISICRLQSYIRAVEAPDLYVSDMLVGELSSGSSFDFKAYFGDSFEVRLDSNPLVYRFSSEILIKDKFTDQNRFFLVSAESDLAAGLAKFLGGTAVESQIQGTESSSGKWSVAELDEGSYSEICDKTDVGNA